MSEIEISTGNIEVVKTTHDVASGADTVAVKESDDLELTVNKREFSIVDDALYAGMSSEETPRWLANLIDTVVDGVVGSKLSQLDDAINSINTSLLELEVAKNQYQELINIEQTVDGVVASKLETLNATVQQNAANIISIDVAKATPDEALALSIDHLNAQINDGDIRALVTNLETAIADVDSANTASISSLEAQYGTNFSTVETILSSSAGQYNANANAITDLVSTSKDAEGNVSYSGIIGEMITKTAEGVASVGASTSSQAYLNDVYAGTVSNSFTDVLGDYVNSGYSYTSTININGKEYESGFGLSVTGNGSGTEADPYESQFWVNAEKFRVTDPNRTDGLPVFSIVGDDVQFNGTVSFGNVMNDGVSLEDTSFGSLTVFYEDTEPTIGVSKNDVWYDTNDANTQYVYDGVNWVIPAEPIDTSAYVSSWVKNTTTIDGGKITTGTIDAQQIAADAINGKNISGSYIYGSYIEGAVIKASFIDLTSTITLTNWQQFTPSTLPAMYTDNFAKNNDGTLVVDSLGYVRLPGNTRVTIPGYSQSESYRGELSYGSNVTKSLSPYSIEYYSYDDYKANTLQRPITDSPTITMTKSGYPIMLNGYCGVNLYGTSASCEFYINGDHYDLHTNLGGYSTTGSPVAADYYMYKNGALVNRVTRTDYTYNFEAIQSYTAIGDISAIVAINAGGFYLAIPSQPDSFVCSGYTGGQNTKIFELISATVVGYNIQVSLGVSQMVIT